MVSLATLRLGRIIPVTGPPSMFRQHDVEIPELKNYPARRKGAKNKLTPLFSCL